MLRREPVYVPRTMIILKPRPAFLEWANRHTPGGLGPISEGEEEELGVAYLLPEFLDAADAREEIRGQAKRILKYHLGLYVEDKKAWPKRLDIAQLETFFELEFQADVVDLT